MGDSIRIADVKKVFSKGDTTNVNMELYEITQKKQDPIPSSYRIIFLSKRYKENLLGPTKLTLEKKQSNYGKKFKFVEIKNEKEFVHTP